MMKLFEKQSKLNWDAMLIWRAFDSLNSCDNSVIIQLIKLFFCNARYHLAFANAQREQIDAGSNTG